MQNETVVRAEHIQLARGLLSSHSAELQVHPTSPATAKQDLQAKLNRKNGIQLCDITFFIQYLWDTCKT